MGMGLFFSCFVAVCEQERVYLFHQRIQRGVASGNVYVVRFLGEGFVGDVEVFFLIGDLEQAENGIAEVEHVLVGIDAEVAEGGNELAVNHVVADEGEEEGFFFGGVHGVVFG